MIKRNVEIKVRLSRKEAETLNKRVKKSGISREAYIRHLIEGGVPREAPPPDYYAMMREIYAIGKNLNQIAQKAHVLNVMDAQRYDAEVRKLEAATTSLWRIDGWLGHVVVYIENPDKTENPAFYEKPDMTDEQAQSLADVIEYAVNSDKTEKQPREDTEVLQRFVSGVNCFPGTAREEMMAVKRRYGKENGTVAYHGYQSFAPGEATPEIAHEIGVKLAQRLWGDRYQVLVATHLDHKNHLHNHFVINTVSFVDGIKFHRTAEDYRAMRETSDALCREYGLSVIEKPQRGKAQHYGEWRAEKEGRPTWKSAIKDDIDEAIRQSMTERQFWAYLQSHRYQYKIGKDISVRPPGKERFVRLARNLGEDYTLARIRERIISHSRGQSPAHRIPPRSCQGEKGHRLSCPVLSLLLSAGHFSTEETKLSPHPRPSSSP